jgi:drug/metabolite transporter (DMT)-like permease
MRNGSTALFVLLWSSGGIFSAWGLKHATPLAFLTLRFTVALIALKLFGLTQRQLLPVRGPRLRFIVTGAFISGGYSICYLSALEQGVTPGTLAVILGIQPILTLLLFERLSMGRFVGLALAMSGLFLVA